MNRRTSEVARCPSISLVGALARTRRQWSFAINDPDGKTGPRLLSQTSQKKMPLGLKMQNCPSKAKRRYQINIGTKLFSALFSGCFNARRHSGDFQTSHSEAAPRVEPVFLKVYQNCGCRADVMPAASGSNWDPLARKIATRWSTLEAGLRRPPRSRSSPTNSLNIRHERMRCLSEMNCPLVGHPPIAVISAYDVLGPLKSFERKEHFEA